MADRSTEASSITVARGIEFKVDRANGLIETIVVAR